MQILNLVRILHQNTKQTVYTNILNSKWNFQLAQKIPDIIFREKIFQFPVKT